jgi:hypothetical protein
MRKMYEPNGGNLRISFSLEDEGVIANTCPFGIEEISTRVKVDQVEHVEQRPPNADDKGGRCHHIQPVEKLPKW